MTLSPSSPSFPAVAAHDIAPQCGLATAPVLLDVRRTPAFDSATRMIAGARRVAPDAVEAWCQNHARQAVIAYCVHGHEVSQRAQQTLAECGFSANFLTDGIEGWQHARYPTIARRPDLCRAHADGASSIWVTRERPKIDRIACPWLIRRFIDPTARFVYLPREQVLEYAQDTGATAYDIAGGAITHQGELCSFDVLMREFDLATPALTKMATIIRAADTDALQKAPEAAGLLAISLGLSALCQDDAALLQRGLLIYDALYAWALQAEPERHQWAA